MRRSIVVAAAVLGGIVGGTLFGDRVIAAADKIMQVAEQNLDANGYIRVHEQGTANVAVTNFPASQNVAVTNLPAVQMVQLAGREAFTAGESINAQIIPDGDVSGEDTFTVPAGKRLVIEFVAAQFILFGGQTPFVLFIDATHNGTIYRYRLAPKPNAQAGYFDVAEKVTIHADPGSSVRVVGSRFPQTAGIGEFVYSVSGYLEPF